MRIIVVFISSLAIVAGHLSCSAQLDSKNPLDSTLNQVINNDGGTISERFPTPLGYKEVYAEETTFGHYLRHLPLKPVDYPVHYFNGEIKPNRSVYCSVIDQDIDAVDLQQCADAVMRLRGEFLFEQKKYTDIHFNFLSDGKPRYFKEYAKGNYSYSNFRKYMKYIFSYANTASLKNELRSVATIGEIQIGDVLIQSGNPYGHAVIVVNLCKNEEGQMKMMLAQSYMPAQETQILLNPAEDNSPWYKVQAGTIYTPEWQFDASDLKRF